MIKLLEKKVKENDNGKPSSIPEFEKSPIFFVKGPPPMSKVSRKKKRVNDSSINLEN